MYLCKSFPSKGILISKLQTKQIFRIISLFSFRQDIIMIVQRLSVATIPEERMIRIAGSFYRKLQMRTFVSHKGKFYMTRCVVGKKRDRFKSSGIVLKNSDEI